MSSDGKIDLNEQGMPKFGDELRPRFDINRENITNSYTFSFYLNDPIYNIMFGQAFNENDLPDNIPSNYSVGLFLQKKSFLEVDPLNTSYKFDLFDFERLKKKEQ